MDEIPRASGHDLLEVGPCLFFGRRWITCASFVAALSACGGGSPAKPDAGTKVDAQVGWAKGVPLPEALTNNAVAAIETEGGCMVFSMLGIDSTLEISGIHNRSYRLREGDSQWLQMPDVPGPGRLAANAVGLRGEPYLVGGYDVASDGTETSSSSLQRFDLRTGRWESMAQLLVPIDDAGVVVWRDQYIVVVSGWSHTGNVAAVQIYDVDADAWTLASEFPGTAVFGQAAAIVGDELIVIDGVRSSALGFSLINQAWRGTLDPQAPGEIAWSDLGGHPGPARYRAAAQASLIGELWFHGGTSEAYNFDGLRYDNGQPASPLASTLTYADGSFTMNDLLDKPTATMDHRGMVACGPRLLTVGGLEAGPSVTTGVWSIVPE